MAAIDVPLIKKSYDLFALLYSLNPRIPKGARYTLWQRCEDISLKIIEQLIRSGHSESSVRLKILNEVSVSLDVLKLLIRLSYETKILDRKMYISAQQPLDEIGRMLGGWIKSLREGKKGE